MKHLSDDDLSKELKQLGDVFRPSSLQIEKMRKSIFTQARPKKTFRIHTLLPTFLSLVVLFSIGVGLYIGLGESGQTNVTASWDGMYVQQISRTSPTYYVLEFRESTLTVKDDFLGAAFMGDDRDREKALQGYKIKEPLLVAGTYENFTVKQKDDTYTIVADGFSYELKQKGPRIFVGEDGIEFSTWKYLDTTEVITDDFTPERLGVVTQSEHTFWAEWGSDAMDRGEHDFEFHEHGKLVVSTDVGELRRGHVVYYHMPPSVIAKNTAIPEMYIGRVVGLPGETVEIKGGQVFIDDKLLDTFYGKATRRGMGEEEYFKNTPNNAIVTEQSTREYFNMNVDPVVIKENTVYILVDQWWRGTDSRDFGAISIDKIEGIIIGYEK